jgi:hypothetical protein
MQKAFDALNPGGYYEMQDPSAPLRSIDGTLEGTAMDRCGLLMFDAFLKRGVDISAPRRHKAMMEAVGFVDVVETVIQWPIGTWAKSRYHKTIGAWYQKDLLAGVEGMCTALFTRGPGALKKEEVDTIIEEVKGNVLDKSIHAYQDL